MVRRTRKFGTGGSTKYDERYKRKTADIEKDYKIALAKGKNENVAKAKYNQRMADAKDDLAKWTKSDRTATKAGEKAAERDLTLARKTKGESMKAAPVMARVAEKAKERVAGKSTSSPTDSSEPKSFKEAFKAARSKLGGGKTFTWQGKSYSTNVKGEGTRQNRPSSSTPAKRTSAPAKAAVRAPASGSSKPVALPASFKNTKGSINMPGAIKKPVAAAAPVAKPKKPVSANMRADAYKSLGKAGASDAQRAAWKGVEREGRLAKMEAAANTPGASKLAKDRYRMAKESGMYAKGGKTRLRKP